ncbi:hypothetical protein ruthe_02776 [Rubellimicrobium thermophilum DSM 16684]|uniref:Uncharacterized protein n=1 Tax=Rubellimicrobium thermophilum DSM 16684 TaxID=1123069 RepID=S9SA88_9RHOB|nr:hypothetical protein ruthe_02776 [Rubellimicrobium thermophilum DSM 16684]
MTPVAHRRDAVGDAADVGHAVRDVEQGHPPLAQPVDQGEEPLGLGRRKGGRRLVEDQQARRMGHGAGDGNQLTVGKRQIRHRARKIHIEPDGLCDPSCLGAHAPPRDDADRAIGNAVKKQIGRHVEIGHDAVVDGLMDGHHTGAQRFTRGRGGEDPPPQRHRPRIRLMDPAEHLDERGLARPVRPHQHGDGPGRQIEIDAAQDLIGAEGLPEPADADRRSVHRILPLQRQGTRLLAKSQCTLTKVEFDRMIPPRFLFGPRRKREGRDGREAL